MSLLAFIHTVSLKLVHFIPEWQLLLQFFYSFPVHFDSLNITYQLMHFYTGCHRRNGPNVGRMFLMLNYTDITQNTYVPS